MLHALQSGINEVKDEMKMKIIKLFRNDILNLDGNKWDILIMVEVSMDFLQ
jgi:hypothetical protein